MFTISILLSEIQESKYGTTTVLSLIVLTINGSTIKYMINIKKPVETEINGHRYKNVEIFEHLCSLVTNTDEVETEIKARIIADSKCFNALGHLLKKRYVMHSLSVWPSKTAIRQTVTYDAESLEWLGNVARMDGERRVKKLLECKPGGERKRGKTEAEVDG